MPKANVRYVEFTPEEMAYDGPPDTSDLRRFPTVAGESWKKFMTFRNGFAKIEDELRSVFGSDKAVNDALRELLRIRASIDSLTRPTDKRRSA